MKVPWHYESECGGCHKRPASIIFDGQFLCAGCALAAEQKLVQEGKKK